MRQYEFGEAIGFLKKRHTGDDEHLRARAAVIVEAGKNLLGTTDERGAGTVTHKSDARPQVWRDFQLPQVSRLAASMKRGHPLLADRVDAGDISLGACDRTLVHVVVEILRSGPGRLFRLAHDHI